MTDKVTIQDNDSDAGSCATEDVDDPHTLRRGKLLWRLFFEFFKISLFVVGGGYAIVIAADDVFGRKLRWTEEGEILANLPIIQSIPGLIAGNSAIYVGRKLAGAAGAFASLVGIALPSIIILTAVGMGFQWLPLDNRYVSGAFLGLRSALCGIVLATVIKSWKKNVRGAYGYIAVSCICVAVIVFKQNPVALLVAAMIFGAMYKCFIEPAFGGGSGQAGGKVQR